MTKPKMIEWTKPTGTKIKTNDLEATVEYCEKLGWKRSRGRPKKDAVAAEVEGDGAE